jgi:hypothetical protein
MGASAIRKNDDFEKSPFSPPLAGGDEGEGILDFYEAVMIRRPMKRGFDAEPFFIGYAKREIEALSYEKN